MSEEVITSEGQLTSFGEEVKSSEEVRLQEEAARDRLRCRGSYCANPDCRWNKELKGGKFIYSHRFKGFICEDCGFLPVPSECKDLWNFTTTHFNGQPIEVKGLNHLRQLEKQFGVSNHAANYERRNWNTPPSVRPHPMNPELERMLGKAKEMGQMDRGSRVTGEFGR